MVVHIQIEEKEIILEENQSAYIPKDSKHRLSNCTNFPLVIIEIQTGSYFREDDIQRFEDDYGENQIKINLKDIITKRPYLLRQNNLLGS